VTKIVASVAADVRNPAHANFQAQEAADLPRVAKAHLRLAALPRFRVLKVLLLHNVGHVVQYR
jgi:hypothetical protein